MENPNVQPPQEEKKQERKATESYYPLQPPSRRGYYTVIAVILMLTVAALFARGHWLRIRDVEVTGLKHYTVEKIAAQAGITAKSTYFNLNESRVAANIEKDRYLRFDGMEKIWPNKVILHVYEREETFNLLNLGVQYILSADGMVLENTNNINLDNGCVKVTGLDVRDIRFGAPLICQDAAQLETMGALMDELELQGVLDKTSELNLTSLESIYIVTLDGYTANIGSAQDLRAKIGTVRAVVLELRKRGLTGGMIEATVPGQASYRPLQ